MATATPCDLEQTETLTCGITISQYKVWQQFGGGYNIVARNGSEIERIHTRSLRQADETFAMLIGKYSDGDYMEQRQASRDADDDYMEQRQASREAAELYEWASGR